MISVIVATPGVAPTIVTAISAISAISAAAAAPAPAVVMVPLPALAVPVVALVASKAAVAGVGSVAAVHRLLVLGDEPLLRRHQLLLHLEGRVAGHLLLLERHVVAHEGLLLSVRVAECHGPGVGTLVVA